MHIFFSGIGGTAIGPLALIAKQAGYEVSGSDEKDSQYIEYLRDKGIGDIHVGQTKEAIAKVHAARPIDWFVHSSALPASHAELAFCREASIKTSKRDELLNKIITDRKLKLVAIAGTHGKTTTTAMAIWLFKQLELPVSYSVGAKISFGDMGHFDANSQYFIYEADEFDRNFLSFHPHLSIISGLGWDHHEIYPSREDYNQAFADFINHSQKTVLWNDDLEKLNPPKSPEDSRRVNKPAPLNVEQVQPGSGISNEVSAEDTASPAIAKIRLTGLYNRRNAWLVVRALAPLLDQSEEKLVELINQFPGLSRRFEKLADNLYTDYAHTPEKIIGAMSVAKEAARPGQKIVVIYEPLTNRRMHHTAAQHKDVFSGVSKIYWVPSFLAREDPAQPVLSPEELVKNLSPELQKIAEPAELNDELEARIKQHLAAGDLVIAMSGGGSGSLDEWLREHFGSK